MVRVRQTVPMKVRCSYCHSDLGEMKFAPGSVVKVDMGLSGWHRAEVIRPTDSCPDYTTVRVFDYLGRKSSDWCVPTKNIAPALPWGYGISLHKALKAKHSRKLT